MCILLSLKRAVTIVVSSYLQDDFSSLLSSNEKLRGEYKNLQQTTKQSRLKRIKLKYAELAGELNDVRDQLAALDVEVAKLTNKCQVREIYIHFFCLQVPCMFTYIFAYDDTFYIHFCIRIPCFLCTILQTNSTLFTYSFADNTMLFVHSFLHTNTILYIRFCRRQPSIVSFIFAYSHHVFLHRNLHTSTNSFFIHFCMQALLLFLTFLHKSTVNFSYIFAHRHDTFFIHFVYRYFFIHFYIQVPYIFSL